jgi:hypothetical protein
LKPAVDGKVVIREHIMGQCTLLMIPLMAAAKKVTLRIDTCRMPPPMSIGIIR